MKKRHKSGLYATKEQLEQDYLVDKLPMDEIAAKYGYADFSKACRAVKRYGIPLRGRKGLPSQYIRPTQLLGETLSPEQRQVIYGSLLGDGTIGRLIPGRKNVAFATTHTVKHKEYIDWHVQMLGPWVSKVYYRVSRPSPQIPYSGDALMLASIVHKEFTDLRQRFYPDGIKIIPDGLLEELTPLAVAVWLMDDSCLSWKGINLATQGFTEAENHRIADWFKSAYGLTATLIKTNGGCGKYLTIRPLEAVRSLFGAYYVPCMRYKLGYDQADG